MRRKMALTLTRSKSINQILKTGDYNHEAFGRSEPAEVQVPWNSSVMELEAAQQGKGFVADDVNDGTNSNIRMTLNPVEKRFQPPRSRLTVGIQKSQNFPWFGHWLV